MCLHIPWFLEEVPHKPFLGLKCLDRDHMPGEIFYDLQKVWVGFVFKLLSLQVESRESVTIEKPTRKRVLARSVGDSLAADRLFDVPFPLQKLLGGSTLKVGNGKVIGSRLAVAKMGFTLEGYVVAFRQISFSGLCRRTMGTI